MNFEQHFNSMRPFIHQYARKLSLATSIPIEEYESAMCEEFYAKYDKYDGRISFNAYIKPKLQQKARRTSKLKKFEYYRKITRLEVHTDNDGREIEREFADSIDVSEEARARIEKSPDKLQLIRALSEKADEVTVAAVNLMLSKPNASLNSIATEMGVHHETLKRKFRRLAKNYDPSRFGDLNQYLAV